MSKRSSNGRQNEIGEPAKSRVLCRQRDKKMEALYKEICMMLDEQEPEPDPILKKLSNRLRRLDNSITTFSRHRRSNPPTFTSEYYKELTKY